MSDFREWLDLQEPETRKAARGFASTLSLAVFVALLIGVLANVPPLQAMFELRPLVPASLYTGLSLFAFGLAAYERRHDPGVRAIASVEVGYALGIELFVATLVAFSQLPGAAVLAGLAIFATTWYGYVFRVSLHYPWHAAGSVVVFVVAAALNPTREHLATFAIVGPTAIFGKLLVGTWAHKSGQHRAETEQLRAAVQAQMLDDQSHKIAELADMLLDVVARNHDVRNAVMAAHISAETLQILSTRDQLLDKRATVGEIAHNLEGSLGRVKMLLDDISNLGRERLAEVAPDSIRVKPVLARIVADVQRRFPSVSVELGVIDGATTVRMAGGEVTLARIVENALVNACEGDGTSHAANVSVLIDVSDEHPYVRLHFKDDGPGFAPDLVDKPVRGFHTTKSGGTGLGLYTLERLTRASGGRIARENDGGALLTVELMRSEATAPAA